MQGRIKCKVEGRTLCGWSREFLGRRKPELGSEQKAKDEAKWEVL